MGDEKFYEDAKRDMLCRYIPADKFRLVGSAYKNVPGGLTEVRVKLNIKKKFADALSFNTSKSGLLFGWVRAGEMLKKEDGSKSAEKIELYDWDNGFLMLIFYKEGSKQGVFVSSEDVRLLLENCMRPNNE